MRRHGRSQEREDFHLYISPPQQSQITSFSHSKSSASGFLSLKPSSSRDLTSKTLGCNTLNSKASSSFSSSSSSSALISSTLTTKDASEREMIHRPWSPSSLKGSHSFLLLLLLASCPNFSSSTSTRRINSRFLDLDFSDYSNYNQVYRAIDEGMRDPRRLNAAFRSVDMGRALNVFDVARAIVPDKADNEISHDALVLLMNALLQDNTIDEELGNHIAGEAGTTHDYMVALTAFPRLSGAGTNTTATTTTTTTTTAIPTTMLPNITQTRGLFDFLANPFAIPQKCWYKSNQYDCGLSVSCVFQGSKPVDLCSGGMIWSCCVPRNKVDAVDENLGAIGNDVNHQQFFSGGSRPSSFNNNRPHDRPPHIDSDFEHDDDTFFPNTHRPSSILRPHRPHDRPFRPPHRPPRPPPFIRPDNGRPSLDLDENFSSFNRPHNTFNHFDSFDNRPHDFARPGSSRPRPPFLSAGPPEPAASRFGMTRYPLFFFIFIAL
nr:uncharacterized protein LOC128689868 [Cherax quadricarinatus]